MSIESSDQIQLISTYVLRQVENLFPINMHICKKKFLKVVSIALDRFNYIQKHLDNKYFIKNQPLDLLHGDKYAMFLYLLSNSAYKNDLSQEFCSSLYLLNKALNSIDVFYEVELPGLFLFVHPVGTVLGRANYSDNLVIYQGCTVGTSGNDSPILGTHVTLHPNSSVLGACCIGDHVSVGASTTLLNKSIVDRSLVVGSPGNYRILSNKNLINPVWKI